MCMMATLRKRHPANVPPIAFRRGRRLKDLERRGRVPKNATIRKKEAITIIFRMTRISDYYIYLDFVILSGYS